MGMDFGLGEFPGPGGGFPDSALHMCPRGGRLAAAPAAAPVWVSPFESAREGCPGTWALWGTHPKRRVEIHSRSAELLLPSQATHGEQDQHYRAGSFPGPDGTGEIVSTAVIRTSICLFLWFIFSLCVSGIYP